MNLLSFQRVKKDTNHLYYNIELVNNETIDDKKNDPVIKYSDFQDVPLLEDCSDYYFSIIRFQLNGIGKNIPVFIPKIEENQNDINKTIYKVGLMFNYSYKGSFYQKSKVLNIQFETQNKHTSPPTKPNDYSNEYYFIYTYNHFIKLVNEAFEKCNTELYEELKIEHNIDDSYKLEAPKMYYENNSQYFKLYLDKKGYGRKKASYLDTNGVLECDIKSRLFFNTNMYNLFSNFHNNYLGGDVKNNIQYFEGNSFTNNDLKTTSVAGCSYEIIPFDTLGLDSYTFSGKDYYVLKQDFESISNFWCPVSSLVFTTNLLPILPEMSGQPIEFKDSGETKGTSVANYEKVITDLIIPLGSPDGYNRCITYYPSSEYRLSEFTKSSFSLRNIGLSGFWKHRSSGRLIPLTLPNQSSISLKIMFRRRTY
jgi:hypothetical protein